MKGHLQYFNGHKKWGSRQSSQESLGHSTFVLVAQCHDPWAGGRLGPTLYDPVPFLVAMTFWISNRNGTQLQGTCKVMTWDKSINVNPGFINPERLFNWEGTIKKYQMKWLLEEYPPNYHKPCLSLIQGWHYNTLYPSSWWNHLKPTKPLEKMGDHHTIGPFLGPKMSTAGAARDSMGTCTPGAVLKTSMAASGDTSWRWDRNWI